MSHSVGRGRRGRTEDVEGDEVEVSVVHAHATGNADAVSC